MVGVLQNRKRKLGFLLLAVKRQWKDLLFRGSASSLVTCKELYISFFKCWLSYGTFCLGNSRSRIMGPKPAPIYPCVDVGISFGRSL